MKALRPAMGLLSLALVLAGVALWAFQAPPPPTEPLQIGGEGLWRIAGGVDADKDQRFVDSRLLSGDNHVEQARGADVGA